MLSDALTKVLKAVPPGLGGTVDTAYGISRTAELPLAETRAALRSLFDAGYVLTETGTFDDHSALMFYGSPTGDLELGYAIVIERMADGRFSVEEPPDPEGECGQEWASFDTEAAALAHAEKIRRLYYSDTMVVRRYEL